MCVYKVHRYVFMPQYVCMEYMYVCVCVVHVCVLMPQNVYRDQRTACGAQGLNSGHQACMKYLRLLSHLSYLHFNHL